jgi:hypothetical protein
VLIKIICATVATLAIVQATSAAAQLAPKTLTITRNSSGGIASVHQFGGNAPGSSTNPTTLQTPGSSSGYQSGYGNPSSWTFIPHNSSNSQQARNPTQPVQGHQYVQPNCTGIGFCWSDLRLKRNVVWIAHLDNGLDLYRFSYNWSDEVYVGVMAQDVMRVVPEAVVRGNDGFLQVNYARLGLRMLTWSEWSASNRAIAVH